MRMSGPMIDIGVFHVLQIILVPGRLGNWALINAHVRRLSRQKDPINSVQTESYSSYCKTSFPGCTAEAWSSGNVRTTVTLVM